MPLPSSKVKIFLPFLLMFLFLSACATPGSSATWSGIYATEKIAYLATGSYVYAIDLQTGQELWRYPEKATANLQFYATPLLTSDGQLIIGSAGNDKALISLDAQTGQERWAAPFRGAKDHWIASPLEWQGALYAPNADGHLYILDLNGNLIASIEIDRRLWAAPVSDGEYLYLASLDHSLYAFDPQTRQILWKTDLKGSIPSHPAIAGKNLFIGSFASRLYAFDLPGGQKRWEATTKGWVWGTPLVYGEDVYIGDLASQIYAFRASDGQLQWQKSADSPIVAGPVAFGDAIVFVSENGGVYAYDPQGNLRWQRQIEGKLYTSPATTLKLLIIAPMHAKSPLLALDGQGNTVWTFTPK